MALEKYQFNKISGQKQIYEYENKSFLGSISLKIFK